jgi:hypothetical protein
MTEEAAAARARGEAEAADRAREEESRRRRTAEEQVADLRVRVAEQTALLETARKETDAALKEKVR